MKKKKPLPIQPRHAFADNRYQCMICGARGSKTSLCVPLPAPRS